MKRLLLISPAFPPNATAGAARCERFARYLQGFDWGVDVVTIKPRRDFFQDNKRLNRLGNYLSVHFTSNFSPWVWLRDKRPRHPLIRALRSILMRIFSFPDHMLLWALFAVKEGLGICKSKGVDAIYTTSPPHSVHLAGLALSQLTRKPWVADFRDPWTLNPYRRKAIGDGILLKVERIMEKAVLEKSCRVLANTQANRKNLLRAFPLVEPDKVVYLPNGWEDFPAIGSPIKDDAPLTIVHAGNFYPRFKPYGLLYALSAWQNGEHLREIPAIRKEDIQVILLGSSDLETKQLVQNFGIEKMVHIEPWVPLEDARRIMCQADALWASLGTGRESSTFVPSKLFEYIASKRPIIGFFPEGEAASLIRETGTGVVFTNDDPNPIIQLLHDMILTKRKKRHKWYNPNNDAINSYHIERIVDKLNRVLDEAIQ
ncbi:MAG: glycosyltransferase family 4 protein [Candidatus Hodarchaeota archaeon]